MTIEATLERIATALERLADREYADVDEARREGERAGIETGKMLAAPDTADSLGELANPLPKKRGRPRKVVDQTAAAPPPPGLYPAPPSNPENTTLGTVPAASFASDFLGTPVTATVEATKPPTKDEVRAALIAFQDKNGAAGKDKVFALIKKYGGTNFSDLPEANYAALVADAK